MQTPSRKSRKCCFTPDGRFLVGGSWKGWVRLWSTDTWKPASRQLTGHAGAILGQSMSPDGRTLATGSADGTIRLWSGPEWKEAKALPPGEVASLAALAWTADGSSLVIAGEDGKVRGRSLADGKITLTCAIPGAVALASGEHSVGQVGQPERRSGRQL